MICAGLICLGMGPIPVDARSRSGSPHGRTVAPNTLSVQQYAVIDLSGAVSWSAVTQIAMSDAHQVAFEFGDADDPPQIVKTWSQGAVGDNQEIPHELFTDDGAVDHVLYLYGLRSSGELTGLDVQNQPVSPYDYLSTTAVKVKNGSPESIGLPTPYENKPGDPNQAKRVSLDLCFSENGYAIDGYYSRLTSGGTPFIPPYAAAAPFVSILTGGAKTIFFDPLTPENAVDTATYRFVRTRFKPTLLNDTGWAVGGIDEDDPTEARLWNGETLLEVGLDDEDFALGINNQGRLLMARYPAYDQIDGGKDHQGALWQDGSRTLLTDLLKGGALQKQIKNVMPLLISNDNTADDSFRIVTSVKDNGQDELVLWTDSKLPQSSARRWELSRMELPPGVDIQWDHLEVISSSGIIAAIGNPGPTSATPGADHALLLVPIGLRLFNGKTTDFDAAIVRKIIPAPENPHYADDKAEQDGDDILGERLPGKGRRFGVSYVCDIMVAAQAPIIPWLHYQWKRTIAKLGWNISKSSDGKSWNVKLREGKPPDTDDEGDSPLFSNNIPSVVKNEFYTYDDTGLRYDPTRPLPFGYDGEAKAGDYVYVEKAFVYKVRTSLDKTAWNYGDADWHEGVTMYVSQTALVKQVALTFLIQKDWRHVYNRANVGILYPKIDLEKVRGIVGGNLPINIEPGANDYPPIP